MQIGSKIEVANRESDTAGEVPSSPGRSPSLYDPCDEAFGASPEAGLQRHDEPRRDPSSWIESRVNGGNGESSDEDYILVRAQSELRATCTENVRCIGLGATGRHELATCETKEGEALSPRSDKQR